ncbi:MAG: hypothetical protein CO002_00655 [Candidatus Portnoybacteria bacterium CG_4_8_14_3_um_filter_44_10]|uniref:SWIM-type domain-containing protein n=5 Tax=Candidatus Portnoyibacteriota TaxID=1817913 RepID=A0A2H0KPH5_9BACT|nr:MAG: hypothetical protein AUK17_02625 [Parcubacteria group bacterium CG2_30_44_18]PIQ74061.1 MAG: hypothetical protein COV85_04145 [Candidatus Portnoybacteria bacterium CG11_big_fil_rev_8_21_14_0_20_44_10]PIS17028.1 MAG: hypothetical protein COT61_00800 [Candidatus Portnoybacteria bacterium CG09_land_8_20_14_0_10_44_13]PIW75686.1 MAG: hypothetical protein CO002_00655 [Candidatus Portnoybacteria bacterium CG_4_8_14_3_um_filter_44_10]PIZ70724.1 MAG: hypothetical protein COY11_02210 [Candidatus
MKDQNYMADKNLNYQQTFLRSKLQAVSNGIKKSATEFLLPQAYKEIWQRGEEYVDWKTVKPVGSNEAKIKAAVRGKKDEYIVILEFTKAGIAKQCNCAYSQGGPPSRPACKHMVATAIFWDEKRGLSRPSKKDIGLYTIAPPSISRQSIISLFKNPLRADLDKIRILVEYSSWSPQPHSRLPNSPKIVSSLRRPLKASEIKKALAEMERWSKRSLYDPYFCAGEMSAAFCELLDVVKKRLAVSKPKDVILIMALLVDWFYKKFNKITDCSEGVWIFPPVRIGSLVSTLLRKYPREPVWQNFRQIVKSAGAAAGVRGLDEKGVAGWVNERLRKSAVV